MHATARPAKTSTTTRKKTRAKSATSDTRRLIQPAARVIRPLGALLSATALAIQAIWTGLGVLAGTSVKDAVLHGPLLRTVFLAAGQHTVLTGIAFVLLFAVAAVLVLDRDATDDLAQVGPALRVPRVVRAATVAIRARLLLWGVHLSAR